MTASPSSVQQAVEEGQGLVRSLALRIHRSLPRRIDLDDLIGYGQVGLVEAAREFDPSRSIRFTTFAYYRIRGAIYDGLAKMTGMSRGHYQHVRYERMANEVLDESSQSGGGNSETELTWLRDVGRALAVIHLVSHLDLPDSNLESSLVDSVRFGPLALAMKQELCQKIVDRVGRLPEDEATLVRAAYFEGLTLQEAGQRLGISKSWATRLHAKALRRLAIMLSGPGF
ncbi:MAG: sigma-70 family RNA polymerase sigma factor [Thermoguttaceae bacterium]